MHFVFFQITYLRPLCTTLDILIYNSPQETTENTTLSLLRRWKQTLWLLMFGPLVAVRGMILARCCPPFQALAWLVSFCFAAVDGNGACCSLRVVPRSIMYLFRVAFFLYYIISMHFWKHAHILKFLNIF